MRSKKSTQDSLFAKKDIITREELLEALRKDKGLVPGFVGPSLRRSERLNLAPAIFNPKRYPKTISKFEFKKELKMLQSRIFKTKDEKLRANLEKKVRYLKKISGL